MQAESLRQAGIEYRVAGPDDDTFRRGSEHTGLGRTKCCRVKPPSQRSLAGRQVRITQKIRSNRHVRRSAAGRKCGACRIGSTPGRSQVLAGIETEDPARFPAADERVPAPARSTCVTSSDTEG